MAISVMQQPTLPAPPRPAPAPVFPFAKSDSRVSCRGLLRAFIIAICRVMMFVLRDNIIFPIVET